MNYLDRNEFNFEPSQKVVEAIKNFDPKTLCFYTRIYDQGKKSVISVRLSEIYGVPENQVLLTYGGEDMLKNAIHYFYLRQHNCFAFGCMLIAHSHPLNNITLVLTEQNTECFIMRFFYFANITSIEKNYILVICGRYCVIINEPSGKRFCMLEESNGFRICLIYPNF